MIWFVLFCVREYWERSVSLYTRTASINTTIQVTQIKIKKREEEKDFFITTTYYYNTVALIIPLFATASDNCLSIAVVITAGGRVSPKYHVNTFVSVAVIMFVLYSTCDYYGTAERWTKLSNNMRSPDQLLVHNVPGSSVGPTKSFLTHTPFWTQLTCQVMKVVCFSNLLIGPIWIPMARDKCVILTTLIKCGWFRKCDHGFG